MNYYRLLYLATTNVILSGLLCTTFAQKWNHNLVTLNAQPCPIQEPETEDCDRCSQKNPRSSRLPKWPPNKCKEKTTTTSKCPPKSHRSDRLPKWPPNKCEEKTTTTRKCPPKSHRSDRLPKWPPNKCEEGKPTTETIYQKSGPIFPHPKYPKRTLLEYKDFILCYDNTTLAPMWTLECIESAKTPLSYERADFPKGIRREKRLHPEFQTGADDYTSLMNKFTIEHLAEFDLHPADLTDPCVWTNIVLQRFDPLDDDADLWDELREYIVYLSKVFDVVYILSGALYLPEEVSGNKMVVRYEIIKGRPIAVPTHFFKALLYRNPRKGGYHLECYVYENENKRRDSVNPIHYLAERHALEREAGFLIFGNIKDSQIRTTLPFKYYIKRRHLAEVQKNLFPDDEEEDF